MPRVRGLADFDLSAREQSSEHHQHGWMDGVARRRLVDHRADILQRLARLDVAARGIEARLVQRLVEFGQHIGVRDVVGVIRISRQDVGDHVRQIVVGRQFLGQEPSKVGHVEVAKGGARPRRATFPARWLQRLAGELLHADLFRPANSQAPSPNRRPTGASIAARRPQASYGPANRPMGEAIHAAPSLGVSARETVRRRSRAKIAEAYSLERMTRDTLSVYAKAFERCRKAPRLSLIPLRLRRLHVLGANADADQLRWNAAQGRKAVEELEERRRLWPLVGLEITRGRRSDAGW